MTAASPIERISAAHARLAPRLGGGAAWARRRHAALGRLVERGLPDRRDENWKYLDHARIGEYAFDAEPAARPAPDSAAARLLGVPGAHRVVLVDGRHSAPLSTPAPTGLEVVDIADLIERDPEGANSLLRAPGDAADDRYALLADAFAAGGVLIRVAAGCEVAEPVYLAHVTTAGSPAVHQARVVVDAGAGARLTLFEHFVALGEAAALGNLAAELALGEGSAVSHLRLHEHGPAAAQVETWVVRAAAHSRYEQHLLVLGGRLLRSNLDLVLEGAHAACRLDGLFLADGDRQVDLLTKVTHRGAATETVQEYRGVAAARGRGAFNGRVTVEASARGSNASQTSRNLLLSPLAEINTRPQLEINVDDVQCRHGATTGTLDDEHVFYLRSRGLDEAAARALLTFAFCRDLIGRVPLAAVREAAEALVAGALPDRDLIRGAV
ncbi:MAG TPA: Fe-S cluster assembly protein SufD [Steroidobacteraceae bacterium]|nr:Fe-S cluster assembly protein SufD [Steroidobacteraceae bacterium]